MEYSLLRTVGEPVPADVVGCLDEAVELALLSLFEFFAPSSAGVIAWADGSGIGTMAESALAEPLVEVAAFEAADDTAAEVAEAVALEDAREFDAVSSAGFSTKTTTTTAATARAATSAPIPTINPALLFLGAGVGVIGGYGIP